jgi:hypothetical protein
MARAAATNLGVSPMKEFSQTLQLYFKTFENKPCEGNCRNPKVAQEFRNQFIDYQIELLHQPDRDPKDRTLAIKVEVQENKVIFTPVGWAWEQLDKEEKQNAE